MNGSAHDFAGPAVDEAKPVRVAIIGAGISGIAMYIRILQYVPDAAITIFDKNPELGGTWWENRYPGVACDIPSHVYQYSFAPNPKWSKLFAPGEEIEAYVKGVAQAYGVTDKIKYSTRVVGATWDEKEAEWVLQTQHTDKDQARGAALGETKADIVVSCVGILNNWKWPDIEGLHDFQGTLLHSACWDKSWDYTGKTVALIGGGSSAIQILPSLQAKGAQVYNFVRGGAWITQPFGSTFTESILAQGSDAERGTGNYSYTPAEIQRFVDDPEYYHSFRRQMESFINRDFPCLFPGSAEGTAGIEGIKQTMREKLASKPGLYEKIEPTFLPGCRRLTPGPGYLDALLKDNVRLVQTPITSVTKDSVLTADGQAYKVDAIACATGFDSSHMPRFPIVGRGGVDMRDYWRHDTQRAVAYLSHTVPGYPNYFIIGGPNASTGAGSLLLILESVMGYVVKAIQKISREHIRTMEAKPSALASWTSYLDSYFPRTVHADNCTSWYKVDGKIVGLWPGSSLHAMKTLASPRWEDFEYTMDSVPEDGGSGAGELSWIGMGWTKADIERGDLGYYVDTPDIPPIPSAAVLARQP